MSEQKQEYQENPNEVCGLWENVAQSGQPYLSSVLSEEKAEKMIALLQSGCRKLLLFKKREKAKETHPDWDLLCVEPGPKRQS